MAFGKPSKKTQNTKAEAPSKTKTAVAATKARTPEPIEETAAKDAAEVASTKIRRRSAAVVKVDSALQENVVTHSNAAVPKTMAAAAGHSITSENGAGVGHANGSANGHTREAIAQRAYFYWAERGFAHGSAEDDWKRAEADLTIK